MAAFRRRKKSLSCVSNKKPLSPTKHSFTEILHSFGESSESINSQSSNLFSSLSSDNNDGHNFSDYTEGKSEAGIGDGTQIDGFQPSSPIPQQKSTFGLDSLFSGFEDLENKEYRPVKIRKLKNDPISRNSTMLFQHEVHVCSVLPEDPEELLASDDELSNDVVSNIKTLHQRITELEGLAIEKNELKISKNDVVENNLLKEKHYGGISRSMKANQRSLSDDEDDSIKEQIDNELSFLSKSSECKSLTDLKINRDHENCKLDFEMMMEQVDYLLNSTNKEFEILQLMVDLATRIHTNDNFAAFLKNSFKSGRKSCRHLIKDLVTTNAKLELLNLLVIIHLELNDVFISGFINLLIATPDLSVKQYLKNFTIPKNKKLLRAMLDDLCIAFSQQSVSSLVLEALGRTRSQYFNTLCQEDKDSIIKLIHSSMVSTSTEILASGLSYLKLIITLMTNNINQETVILLGNLFCTLDAEDTTLFTLLLEITIVLVCTNEGRLISENIFSSRNWKKIWLIIDDANLLHNIDALNERRKKQALLATGFAFSFIDNDYNITKDDLKLLKKSLMIDIFDSEYSILQYHYIGYITCISHHFLRKFNHFGNKETNQIKKLCKLFHNSDVMFEDRLGAQIRSIVGTYSL